MFASVAATPLMATLSTEVASDSGATAPLMTALSTRVAAASGSNTAQTTAQTPTRSTESEDDRDITKPPSSEGAGTSGSQTDSATSVAAMGAKTLLPTSMTPPLFLIEAQGMRLQSPAPSFGKTSN